LIPMPNSVAEFLFDQMPMSHRFYVRIDRSAFDLGSWSRVSGLSVGWAKLTHRSGEDNNEQVFPGNISYPTIKLTRSACSDSATVQKWLASTTRHRESLSGGIHLLDFTGLPVITWELKEFFPIGWSISDFDSGGSKPVTETLELAHNGFLDDEGKVG